MGPIVGYIVINEAAEAACSNVEGGKNKSKLVWMMLSGSKHRGLSRTYTTKICLSRLLRISPCQDVDNTQHVPLQRVDGNVRHEAEAFYICSCSLGTEEKHRISAWILA